MQKDKPIKCYLCEEDAEQYHSPDTSRNKIVECKKCGMYELTSHVLKFHIDEDIGLYYPHEHTSEEIPFCQEQKNKLSRFVQKNCDLENRKPAWIDMKRITAETGKRSGHVAYK
ncbi:MAG: hypothetical protein ACFFDI_25655 [Promethearchaeota archaeon]